MACFNCKKVLYTNQILQTCESDVIDLGFYANYSDSYTLKLSFLNTELSIEKEIGEAEKFSFPATGLNENQEWLCSIFDSVGNLITYTNSHGNVFDCFHFRTAFKIQL